jgi:2-polyprenyl-3-methyl-5-hydroxy-6-metoxy-1,4-benzoquinol methylase
MTTLDKTWECNEYRNLLTRGGRDYSVGHQIMYLAPIMLIAGKPNSILDVGAGIGFGLRHMIESSCVGSYTGYEPCKESYDYIRVHYGSGPNITLLNEPFTGTDISYDYVFCIEVLEHVEHEDARIKFLQELSLATYKTMFLSTPDKTKSDHGVYTEAELVRRLYKSGFDNVIVMPEQWTTLYICS